ncbi:hypothetical protein H0X06_00345 [Candidatus Dependentiae bacterium]|nr:hypothetical protein [Candidatus Dependentiae bacterium]
MIKKTLIACMMVVPATVYAADWLDDVAALYSGTSFDESKALAIVEGYRKKDESEIKELEKKAALDQSTGFWETIREGTFKTQLAALNAEVSFYKKVERSLKNFSENKKDKEKFMIGLKTLNGYKKDLEEIRADYRADSGNVAKVKNGTAIAAKEAQIVAYKTYLKGLFLLPEQDTSEVQ